MLTLCYIHTVLEFGSFEIVALGLKRKRKYNNDTATMISGDRRPNCS